MNVSHVVVYSDQKTGSLWYSTHDTQEDGTLVKMRHRENMTRQRSRLVLHHLLHKTKLHRAAHNMISLFCIRKGARQSERRKVVAAGQKDWTEQQKETEEKLPRKKKQRQEAKKHGGEMDAVEAEETNAERDQQSSGEAPHMAVMTGMQTKIHSSSEISSKPLRGPPPLLLLSPSSSSSSSSSPSFAFIPQRTSLQSRPLPNHKCSINKRAEAVQFSFFVLTPRPGLYRFIPPGSLTEAHQWCSIKGRGNSLSPAPPCVLILPADCLVVFVRVWWQN